MQNQQVERWAMPFEKGNRANPGGRPKEKAFRDALRVELAAFGEDHKALRKIARNLIALAGKDEASALPAIREIADRLDGKVPQGIGGDNEIDPIRITGIERLIVDPDEVG